MIVKIKKRSLIILLILALASLPLVYAVASVVTGNFKVELVISNRNPTINLLNATNFSVNPVSGSTSSILISFNATDPDAVEQINGTTGGAAAVNLTLGTPGSSQFRTQASCTNTTLGSGSTGVVTFNCLVNLQYFDNNSANWVINVSVTDSNNGVGRNNSNSTGPVTFTYNTLSALSLPYASINFSNVNIGQNNVLAYPHLLLNNTGNDDFTRVNISATALVGTTTSSQTIATTQFGVNTTNSSTNPLNIPASGGLSLTDQNTGTFSKLTHGSTSAFVPNTATGNMSVFVYVNVPSSGLSAQLYNATWNVTATSTP